jgi:Ca-activated chloride channel homolog
MATYQTKSLSTVVNSLDSRRRGSATVLILAMMFVFVVSAAITIDYAYMQLVRTELRSATDAAAKAGAEALSRTQSVSSARSEAIRYAACNTVGGRPFQLNSGDVAIGRVNASSSGKWEFVLNGAPPNAVRINARTGSGASQPAVPLFFSGIIGHSGFTPAYQATAGQQEVEICLCLDRSGSMTFDMTGNDFSFAPNNPLLNVTYSLLGLLWQNMLSPPHPTGSRWSALDGAIDVFLNEVGTLNTPPRTALVTWGSSFQMPITPFTVFNASTKELILPSSSSFSWTNNANSIRSVVGGLGARAMMGGTNLSAGLDAAVEVLEGTNGNNFASKVVVLLTDGEWNEGRNPINAAYDARAKGIIVHCVSMLTEQQAVLQQIADITGGRYYGTTNETELRNAFSAIARSLPVVLTE